MKPKIRTQGDLSLSSAAHQAAISLGDEHYRLWQRNVADRFKDKNEVEIKEILQQTSHPFAVCFEHWCSDFNLSTGVRNANAFNACEVFYLGDRKWDKRGAVGVHNYTEVKWLPTIDDFLKLKERYVIVGIDNVSGAVPLSTYRFVPNTLFVFGEEGVGLTPGMQSLCQDIVEIEMYGSVRSLNCGTASGILMHDFIRQMRDR